MASCPSKICVFGVWPIATKTPCTGRSCVAPDFVDLTRTPVTPDASPSTSSSVWSHTTRTLPSPFVLASSRSIRIASARNLSRRWITVTFFAMLDR